MNEKTCVIGLDFGTLSVRAAVVRACDGRVLSDAGRPYDHGVLSGCLPDGTPLPDHAALAVPGEYLQVLPEIIRECLAAAGVKAEDVAGLGIDATTCTLLPVDRYGRALAERKEYQNRPHAYMKLWKHHSPMEQTARLQNLAVEKQAGFLRRCGNHLSCEWAVPKIMEIRDEDQEVYRKTAYFVELADWVNWTLAGGPPEIPLSRQRMRSKALAGLKSFYSPEEGYPPEEFFDTLYPGFGSELREKLWGTPDLLALPGTRMGTLCREMADILGLPEGICLSAGMADGHSSMAALGICEPGTASLVVGTSNVMAFLCHELREIDGICAVAKDVMIPGFYGYDTGQSATGDMLGWLVENMIPARLLKEAKDRKMDIHSLLCEKAVESHPWENQVTVLDWWNGNRNILCDPQLKGQIVGLNLQTRPEEIYCAMLQSIACGTRVIMERCRNYGVEFHKIMASGGIPAKNRLLAQEYADILRMPVHVATEKQLPAKGAALMAAAAAGLYRSAADAMEHMKTREFLMYEPRKEYETEYEQIYRRYLHYYGQKQI